MKEIKVGFICVHNSCRSQIAEFLGRKLGNKIFKSFSAGTNVKSEINKDTVMYIKELYNEDIEKVQYPKLISDIPKMDIMISMG